MTTLLLELEGPRPLRAAMVTTGPTGHAEVRRVRVTLRCPHAPDRVIEDAHVRVRMPAAASWPALADVLLERGRGESAAEELAQRHPGALVTAAHLGTRCWLRAAGREPTRLTLGPAHFAHLPWQSWASLCHAWLVAGFPARELAATRVRVLRVSRAPEDGAGPRTHGRAPRQTLRAVTPPGAPAAPSPRG